MPPRSSGNRHRHRRRHVLVYASDEADPVHRPARALVERLAAGPEIVYHYTRDRDLRRFDGIAAEDPFSGRS
ncbi:MAG: hypothetical protein JSS68_14395 [Actinobacteria bacterium]|nr:hypothetical protein [Actinomycetota bacterium]